MRQIFGISLTVKTHRHLFHI